MLADKIIFHINFHVVQEERKDIIMRIDAHAHGMHAELRDGRRIPPLMSAWRNTDITPMVLMEKSSPEEIASLRIFPAEPPTRNP
jgi:hypothetical protein